MDDTVRSVAWAIAETWWRKNHRVAAGSVPEASTSQEYADNFWQNFCGEARAAIAAVEDRMVAAAALHHRPASDRFA